MTVAPRGQALIPFGQRIADGAIVIASETPRGAACGCVCPQCGEPLQSHQGERLAWHFQHQGASSGCAYGFETGLHKFAKQVIAEKGGLFFPPLIARASGFFETVKLGRWAKIKSAVLEHRVSLGERFIVPDIIVEVAELVTSDGKLAVAKRTVFVEIYVNHETQQAKRDFLVANNIAAFEIDLSALRNRHETILYTCIADILRDAPRYWIWHPVTDRINAALEAKITERRQLQQKIKDIKMRIHARRITQDSYRVELLLKRNAVLEQKLAERELDEFKLDDARDAEFKRRERDKWARECQRWIEDYARRSTAYVREEKVEQ